MINKIAILTSGHPPYDERIYWKFARSLSSSGFEVSIICSTGKISSKHDNISIFGFDGAIIPKRKKLSAIYNLLKNFSPGLIICCEPLVIFSAYKYKKSVNKNCIIILDVTEWYPENVAFKHKGLKKFLLYFSLFKLNILVSNLVDHIIVGEIGKKKRYDTIAPFKKKTIISYYPVLKYFSNSPPSFSGNKLTLCYAGLINFERGILTLLEAAQVLAKRHSELEINLKIIGKFQYENEKEKFNEMISGMDNPKVEIAGWVEYPKISEQLKNVDICFDLRKRTFIYNNSLPIKIFEYLAVGKPIIYSDILPIKNEFDKINFGYLVDPENKEEIIEKIEIYIRNKALLSEHSRNARRIIEKGKNWETESKKLTELISALSKS